MTFPAFPNEVLIHVFSGLDLKDLVMKQIAYLLYTVEIVFASLQEVEGRDLGRVLLATGLSDVFWSSFEVFSSYSSLICSYNRLKATFSGVLAARVPSTLANLQRLGSGMESLSV